MEYLPETQVEAFAPATNDDLAMYITVQRGRMPLFPWVLGAAIVLSLVALAIFPPLVLLPIAVGVPASIYGFRLDYQRTHVALTYQLDPPDVESYQQLCA